MDAIILSGLPAVGKTTVARMLAEKLGVPVLGGGDILKEIAAEHGVKTTGDDWWDTAEGMKFLEERKKSPEFDKEVDRRLLARVDRGDAVITSYTLPWLAKKGVKVWLAGTTKSRAERMSKRDGMPVEECEEVIVVRDKENLGIYKKLYGIEFGKDITPFQLVVGTDGVDAQGVALQIMDFLKAGGKKGKN